MSIKTAYLRKAFLIISSIASIFCSYLLALFLIESYFMLFTSATTYPYSSNAFFWIAPLVIPPASLIAYIFLRNKKESFLRKYYIFFILANMIFALPAIFWLLIAIGGPQ